MKGIDVNKPVHKRRAQSELERPISSVLSAILIAGTFAILFWRELRSPLRREVESKRRRTARNFAVAACSASALHLTERPVTAILTRQVQVRRWGLLKQIVLPRWLEVFVGVLLLDYTLYVWHVLTHKVPFLWRFHKVHHVDLDLDASTALRFHFGEMIISVLFRALQVVLLGIAPRTLSVWNTALLMEIIFHHSNARLPFPIERWLCKFVVTPRMHGIHHSIVPEETDSNWSSGLTVWDWLHGTLRLNTPQREITIGTADYRDPAQVTLPKILKMPFVEQRPGNAFRGNEMLSREAIPIPVARMLP